MFEVEAKHAGQWQSRALLVVSSAGGTGQAAPRCCARWAGWSCRGAALGLALVWQDGMHGRGWGPARMGLQQSHFALLSATEQRMIDHQTCRCTAQAPKRLEQAIEDDGLVLSHLQTFLRMPEPRWALRSFMIHALAPAQRAQAASKRGNQSVPASMLAAASCPARRALQRGLPASSTHQLRTAWLCSSCHVCRSSDPREMINEPTALIPTRLPQMADLVPVDERQRCARQGSCAAPAALAASALAAAQRPHVPRARCLAWVCTPVLFIVVRHGASGPGRSHASPPASQLPTAPTGMPRFWLKAT